MRFLDRTSNIDALRQYKAKVGMTYKAKVGMTGTNSKNPILTCPTFYRYDRLCDKAMRYEARFPAFVYALKPAPHVYDRTHHHRNNR